MYPPNVTAVRRPSARRRVEVGRFAPSRPLRSSVWLAALLLSIPVVGGAEVLDFTSLPIEELMKVPVVSASKRAQEQSEVPGAVFVLSSSDIRRSGVHTLADALRLVPGVDVATMNGNTWGITARGFNGQFANKILVMVDGRTVYSVLFSGVFWSGVNLPIDEIDRVEVIRGTGGAIWGINAVSGVINIITKSAHDTKGLSFRAGAGDRTRTSMTGQLGGDLGDAASYRVHGHYFAHDNRLSLESLPITDDWNAARGGFRLDWDASPGDAIFVSGEAYRGEAEGESLVPTLDPPYETRTNWTGPIEGANLLARWDRTLGARSDASFQAYCDYSNRAITETFAFDSKTLDTEVTARRMIGAGSVFLSGLQYRLVSIRLEDSFSIDFPVTDDRLSLFGSFLQYEQRLPAAHLTTVLGARLDRHWRTGWEFQPNARLAFQPSDDRTLWAAVSRAVRTPSVAEEIATFRVGVIPLPSGGPDDLPMVLTLSSREDYKSEEVVAWELGYRLSPIRSLSIDLAGFYNDYVDLTGMEPSIPKVTFIEDTAYPELPLHLANLIDGSTRGIEAVFDWRTGRKTRLVGSYSYLDMDLRTRSSSPVEPVFSADGGSPRHSAFLHASVAPTRRLELDAVLRWVDELPALDIDSYLVADLRAGWNWSSSLGSAIILRDLLASSHSEFDASLFGASNTRVEPSVYLELEWK